MERLVIAITGASGAAYGVVALRLAHQLGVETHLIVSRAGSLTIAQETTLTVDDVSALADNVYSADDIAAPIASGSYATSGMLVAPCSMRTLAEVAQGVSGSLISRAADVALKERRRLVLITREAPLTSIHLTNMLAVTQAGGIIFPPVPAFFTAPATIDDMVTQTVARALSLFNWVVPGLRSWGDEPSNSGM